MLRKTSNKIITQKGWYENMNFRKLKADEINVRVQSVNLKGKSCWLLYKDARCDMNILDETLGAMNWQRDHKELKGNIYCGVSVWDETKKQWITKWDCGAESMADAEKGEASDSFKRACFNLGIGRELYTSPSIWVDLNEDEFEVYDVNGKKKANAKGIYLSVKEIEYEGNNISKLVIVDSHNQVRFNFPKNYTSKQEKSNVAQKSSLNADLVKELNELGGTLEQLVTYFKLDSVDKLTNAHLENVINKKKAGK